MTQSPPLEHQFTCQRCGQPYGGAAATGHAAGCSPTPPLTDADVTAITERVAAIQSLREVGLPAESYSFLAWAQHNAPADIQSLLADRARLAGALRTFVTAMPLFEDVCGRGTLRPASREAHQVINELMSAWVKARRALGEGGTDE